LDSEHSYESSVKAWEMIPKIAKIIKSGGDNEIIKKACYIRAILKNRCDYVPADIVKRLIDFSNGNLLAMIEMEAVAKASNTWSAFRRGVGL